MLMCHWCARVVMVIVIDVCAMVSYNNSWLGRSPLPTWRSEKNVVMLSTSHTFSRRSIERRTCISTARLGSVNARPWPCAQYCVRLFGIATAFQLAAKRLQ